MGVNNAADPAVWGYVFSGGAVLVYGLLLWAQSRFGIVINRRVMYLIRLVCLCLLLVPLGLRYHYSELAIVYFSLAIVMLGLLIKLKRSGGW